jgi:hypothetical protein
VRHPTPGYIQGLNDIVVPFVAVFINEVLPIDYGLLRKPQGFKNVVDSMEEVSCCSDCVRSKWTVTGVFAAFWIKSRITTLLVSQGSKKRWVS